MPDNDAFQLIPINKIRAESQVRKEFENLDALARSMKARGQLVPITVYPDPKKKGHYIVLHGERRLRAAAQAGLEELKSMVTVAPTDNADRITGQLIENMQRDSMKPMEISVSLQALADSDMTQEQIAEATGLHRSMISRYLRLSSLPEDLASLVNQGLVDDVMAVEPLKRAYRMDPKMTMAAVKRLQDEAAEDAKEEGNTVAPSEALRITRGVAEKICKEVSICQTASTPVSEIKVTNNDTSMHLAPRGGGSGGSSGSSGSSGSVSTRSSSHEPKKSGKEQIEEANPFMAPPPAFETEADEDGAVTVGNSSWKPIVRKDPKPVTEAAETDTQAPVKKELKIDNPCGIDVDQLPEGCHLTMGIRNARISVNVFIRSDFNGDLTKQHGWLETNVVCDDPAYCCVRLDEGTYLDFPVNAIQIEKVVEYGKANEG